MQSHNLQVKRTARYYTLGELNDNTKAVWFLIHGYAQPANSMLQDLEWLADKGHFLVAPEALSRFYVKGFEGGVGASWMTKDERQNEINDYLNYLDQLWQHLMLDKQSAVKKILLGFSQGTATASRWAYHRQHPWQALICWAGGIAHDIDLGTAKHPLRDLQLISVLGDKDPLIPEQAVSAQEKLLKAAELPFEIIRFDGEHRLDVPTFKLLEEKLR